MSCVGERRRGGDARPYATAETTGYTFLGNSGNFQVAISQLKSHASSRAAAVAAYLGG